MPGDADLSQTLDALERKLRDLERELGGSAPAPAAPPPSPAPASTGAGLGELAREIDDLARFREQLQRIGRELEEEYERVLERLGAPAPAPRPPAPPEPSPQPAPAGRVTIDAGPFADLDALAAFEQALLGIDGVEAVEITGFEGRRALAEVQSRGPLALQDALPGATVRSEGDRLVVDLGTDG